MTVRPGNFYKIESPPPGLPADPWYDPYVDDDGFTANVMAKLPVCRAGRKRPTAKAPVLVGCGLLGGKGLTIFFGLKRARILD